MTSTNQPKIHKNALDKQDGIILELWGLGYSLGASNREVDGGGVLGPLLVETGYMHA